MGLNEGIEFGQTPLDENEIEGLLIRNITTQAELNEYEQENIQKALRWVMKGKFRKDEIITEAFVRLVHKKMYEDVWEWAGDFRQTEKNIGVTWPQIATQLKSLLDDCRYWIEHKTFPDDEIAIRFKHRLVSIHCFSNGNGRHSRLMADLIINKILGKSIFFWKPDREQYIKALQAADTNNFAPLIEFARK